MITFLCVFIAVGLIYIGVGVPLWQRRIRRNPWYGLRCPDSLSSDAVWYESNAICGKQFVQLGAVFIAVAGALYFVRWSDPEVYALALCGVLTFGTILVAVLSLSAAQRIRRRIEGDGQ